MNIICKIFLSSLSIGSAAVISPCRFEPNHMGSHFCSDDQFSSTCSQTPPLFSSIFLTHFSRSMFSWHLGSIEVDTHLSSIFPDCLTGEMLIRSTMVPSLTSPSLKVTYHNFYGAVIAISSNMKVSGNHNKKQSFDIQQSIEAAK